MKINKPRISYTEDKEFKNILLYDEYNNYRFTENVEKAITISNITFDSCIFKNTDLIESSFIEVETKNIIFDKVNLNNSEIIKANLKDVDVSSCDICNIRFDMISLKGIIVDRFQCQNIVGMLGVQIKLTKK